MHAHDYEGEEGRTPTHTLVLVTPPRARERNRTAAPRVRPLSQPVRIAETPASSNHVATRIHGAHRVRVTSTCTRTITRGEEGRTPTHTLVLVTPPRARERNRTAAPRVRPLSQPVRIAETPASSNRAATRIRGAPFEYEVRARARARLRGGRGARRLTLSCSSLLLVLVIVIESRQQGVSPPSHTVRITGSPVSSDRAAPRIRGAPFEYELRARARARLRGGEDKLLTYY